MTAVPVRRLTGGMWIGIAVFVLAAVAVVAFVADGGVSPAGTPSQSLERWVVNTGLGQSIGTLHDDDQSVDSVITGRKGTSAVHTVCGVLSTDAESAGNDLPSPNTTVTAMLEKAYSWEYDAGTDCYNAGATNTSLLAHSATERSHGEQELLAALAEVHTLTGTTVSTTTTTVPTTSIFG